MELKGFHNLSMYSWEKRVTGNLSNCGTHCRKNAAWIQISVIMYMSLLFLAWVTWQGTKDNYIISQTIYRARLKGGPHVWWILFLFFLLLLPELACSIHATWGPQAPYCLLQTYERGHPCTNVHCHFWLHATYCLCIIGVLSEWMTKSNYKATILQGNC